MMTVACRRFRLDLEQDAIFSLNAASAGGHRSLDYVPGGALRGVVGRHYDAFGQDAWTVFHSGAVCFGNAYPLLSGVEPAMPIPLSWHHKKGAEHENGGALVAGIVSNLAKAELPGEKLEQLRENYICSDFRIASPQVQHRQKTAIDRYGYGRPRAGALFGYSGLRRGQSFWFDLIFVDVPHALQDQVTSRLTEGPISLGRSRHAEYGRALIARMENAGASPYQAAEPSANQERVSVYLMSDLAPTPRQGDPVEPPSAPLFHLPEGWKLDWKRTYLRGRTYAPFNGAWRLFGQDRRVWEKGSVITFEVPEDDRPRLPHILDVARQLIAVGVGFHRAEGLGRVLIEPWLLAGDSPQPVAAPASSRRAADKSDEPTEPICHAPVLCWAKARAYERLLPVAAETLVAAVESDLVKLYRRAEQEAVVAGKDVFEMAPSKAQWGALADEVAGHASRAAIDDALFREPKSRGPEDRGGFCYSGVGAKKWRFEDPMDRLGFVKILKRFTNESGLKEEISPLLSVDATGSIDRLCRLGFLLLSRRIPRVLAHLRLAERRAG